MGYPPTANERETVNGKWSAFMITALPMRRWREADFGIYKITFRTMEWRCSLCWTMEQKCGQSRSPGGPDRDDESSGSGLPRRAVESRRPRSTWSSHYSILRCASWYDELSSWRTCSNLGHLDACKTDPRHNEKDRANGTAHTSKEDGVSVRAMAIGNDLTSDR